jgi:4-hydroxy-tetrahydrodipicolinate synthase
MALKLHGIIPPIATPMHADGSLNLDAVPALVEHLIAGGVHGIFAPGSQGEAFALSASERLEVIEAVLKAVNGRVPVLAGTGTITTRDSIKLTQEAERLGVDAASIITPYFITPSQDELYAHYAEIANAVSLPILAYSNPSRTGGIKIAPSTLAKLATNIPHFIGVKDSSGDLSETATIINGCPPDFQVFVGRDTLIYGGLCYGAVGAVAMTGNVVPGLLVGIYDAFQKGDHACARDLQAKLAIFRDAIPRLGSYPAPIKEALNMMGLYVGPSRKPIQPLSEAARADLRTILQQLDIQVQ